MIYNKSHHSRNVHKVELGLSIGTLRVWSAGLYANLSSIAVRIWASPPPEKTLSPPSLPFTITNIHRKKQFGNGLWPSHLLKNLNFSHICPQLRTFFSSAFIPYLDNFLHLLQSWLASPLVWHYPNHCCSSSFRRVVSFNLMWSPLPNCVRPNLSHSNIRSPRPTPYSHMNKSNILSTLLQKLYNLCRHF